MKRYSVRFTPEAEADLLHLYDVLLEKNINAAEQALTAISGLRVPVPCLPGPL